MPHDNHLFDDTPPHVAARIVQHWRETPPLRKLELMSSLNATVEYLALAGLARRYPYERASQHRRRLYERRYGAAIVALVYAQRGDDDTGT